MIDPNSATAATDVQRLLHQLTQAEPVHDPQADVLRYPLNPAEGTCITFNPETLAIHFDGGASIETVATEPGRLAYYRFGREQLRAADWERFNRVWELVHF